MAIQYVCRYCRTPIGRIEDDRVTEMQLGFHWLTPEERKDIISYELDGEIRVQVICDTCQEMLQYNPELSLLPNPFQ